MRALTLPLLAVLVSCSSGPGSSGGGSGFDGERAFARLEHLCRMGPRAPGTQGAEEAKAYMMRELREVAREVTALPFEGRDPATGQTFALTNVFARLDPGKTRQVLLVTHWDTRLWADRDPDPAKHDVPIVGANDGGSGVAVILELCRLFRDRPPAVGVDVLFTDGEDLGRPGSQDYWQGSIHFSKGGCPVPDYRPSWALVLDMVGDRDLKILRDGFSLESAPALVERIWAKAEALGHGASFPREGRRPIKDDQVPLWENLKIPSALLIDFEYGPDHGWFHSVEDDLDKCSAASLRVVGEVVAALVYEEGDQ